MLVEVTSGLALAELVTPRSNSAAPALQLARLVALLPTLVGWFLFVDLPISVDPTVVLGGNVLVEQRVLRHLADLARHKDRVDHIVHRPLRILVLVGQGRAVREGYLPA